MRVPELREGGEAMSMLSNQCDELRDRAKVLRQGNWSDGADDAALMEQAADTIEGLRNRLQASEDVTQSFEWAELQSRLSEAEHRAAMLGRIADDQKSRNRDMRNTVNAVTGAGANSRWFELFGTPERAARTLFEMCRDSNGGSCAGCPILGSDVDDCSDVDALLEWLKGES